METLLVSLVVGNQGWNCNSQKSHVLDLLRRQAVLQEGSGQKSSPLSLHL